VIGGGLVAFRWELFKLAAQRRTWLGVATAAIGRIVYLLLELAQGPPKAPLADNLGHTGVGFALVVFKLIAVIGPAIIVSLVAGDIVASEESDGTLKTVLTRSLSRGELLGGKMLALFTYLAFAMSVFFVVSTVGTVIYAMSLQGVAAIAAIKSAHPYLLTNQLTAWHDLFQTPTAGAAIVRSLWVSTAFALPPLIAAMVIFSRRDVAT
jgi:ABC-2 type transport system permease protein